MGVALSPRAGRFTRSYSDSEDSLDIEDSAEAAGSILDSFIDDMLRRAFEPSDDSSDSSDSGDSGGLADLLGSISDEELTDFFRSAGYEQDLKDLVARFGVEFDEPATFVGPRPNQNGAATTPPPTEANALESRVGILPLLVLANAANQANNVAPTAAPAVRTPPPTPAAPKPNNLAQMMMLMSQSGRLTPQQQLMMVTLMQQKQQQQAAADTSPASVGNAVGSPATDSSCSCDQSCVFLMDCCTDFLSICVMQTVPSESDGLQSRVGVTGVTSFADQLVQFITLDKFRDRLVLALEPSGRAPLSTARPVSSAYGPGPQPVSYDKPIYSPSQPFTDIPSPHNGGTTTAAVPVRYADLSQVSSTPNPSTSITPVGGRTGKRVRPKPKGTCVARCGQSKAEWLRPVRGQPIGPVRVGQSSSVPDVIVDNDFTNDAGMHLPGNFGAHTAEVPAGFVAATEYKPGRRQANLDGPPPGLSFEEFREWNRQRKAQLEQQKQNDGMPTCWCDEDCHVYNECCPDFESVCYQSLGSLSPSTAYGTRSAADDGSEEEVLDDEATTEVDEISDDESVSDSYLSEQNEELPSDSDSSSSSDNSENPDSS